MHYITLRYKRICSEKTYYSWDPKSKNFFILILGSTFWIPRVRWYIFGKKPTHSWDPTLESSFWIPRMSRFFTENIPTHSWYPKSGSQNQDKKVVTFWIPRVVGFFQKNPLLSQCYVMLVCLVPFKQKILLQFRRITLRPLWSETIIFLPK